MDTSRMGGSVKAGWVGLVCVLVVGASGPVRADAFGTQPRNTGSFGGAFDRPSLWVVGVTVDRAAGFDHLDDEDPVDDQLFGLSATWQRSWFGLHSKLLITPHRRFRRSRTVLAFGPRLAVSVFGRRLSYGVNVQGEAALDDHRWLLYVSPVELGGDLYAHGSFHIQLFAGVRYAAAGALIKNMMIDPNGFASDVFEDELDDMLDSPWEGYVSLVFGRTIE